MRYCAALKKISVFEEYFSRDSKTMLSKNYAQKKMEGITPTYYSAWWDYVTSFPSLEFS